MGSSWNIYHHNS